MRALHGVYWNTNFAQQALIVQVQDVCLSHWAEAKLSSAYICMPSQKRSLEYS